MKRIVVTEPEMLALVMDPRQRDDLVTFGFGPSGTWMHSESSPQWALDALKEMREGKPAWLFQDGEMS